jgi:hypothetical protein
MKKIHSNPFYRIACLFFLLFIINITAKASVINVPADFSTIQAAINSAQSGDVVLVQAGHYSETLVLKAGIALKGSGLGVTFIDGGGTGNSTGSVIQIDGSGCSIEGFTIQNANLNPFDNLGAGIDGNFFSFTARANRIRNCRVGIRIIGSTSGTSSIIERNIIQDNPGLCGIAAISSTNVQIINNTIYNSVRGIQYTGSSFLDLINNIVMNNSQYGIVSFDNVVAVIKYNDVFNNGTNYGFIPDQTSTNGNLSADPFFVSESSRDFNLTINSPCIDSGDPSTPSDPDATRTDIGAVNYVECLLCYCTTGLYDATWNCVYNTAINDFTLSNIHQTATGCSGEYADYTSMTCNMARGESYLFTATSTSNYSLGEFLGIWIDFNDNGRFSDAGELIFTSTTGGEFSGVIPIPATAPLGNHRMRVRLKSEYGAFILSDACKFFYIGEAHDYTVNISEPPFCKGLSSLAVSKIKKFSATVDWGCGGCTGPYVIEYGLAGFTPGAGNTAGTGGTIVNTNSSPFTISGLLSYTEYEVYVRRKCGASDFSLNFGPVKFRTIYDACGSLQTITCNQVIAETVSIGKGEFDYYPNTGSILEGKEKIYQFTPTVTGKYVLSVSSTNYILAYYFLKEASLGCDRYSWKQIGGAYSAPAMILIGTLEAGKTYFIMIDTQNGWETQQEFKIECASEFNPCTGIDPITCNTPTDFVIPAGAGAFDVPIILSQWDQYVFPGKEKIFSYTATTSGKIRLKVGAADFTYGAAFFIKNATDGCNANNWTSFGYNSGFSSYSYWYSSGYNVTAGTTYYIMCDAWGLEGRSLNMEISCPETWEPCSNILPVTCGDPVIADIPPGLGKFDLPIFSNQCGYSTLPGKELIYSFTPSQTGYYKIDVTASEYKRVNYMLKEAGTCNGDNWLCMGGAVSSTSFLTPVSLSAGHTYYILLDAEEVLTATSQTFTIDCTTLPDPCSSITNITCGQTLDISIPNGLSFFSPYLTYNGEMRGKEKIVQFTPSTTGTYFLKVTNRTGSTYGTYAIKPASDGCTINNWETIYQNYYNNTCLIPMQLVAGTAYYILVENQYGQYGYGEVNETMEIICPSETYNPCATITTIAGCGSSVTSNNPAGVGSYVTSSLFFNSGSGIVGPAGKENIFQFTPSVTGRYILKTTAGTGEVSFAIKEASGGCNGSGWTYIGNAGGQWYYYPSNFPIPIKLIAGTNYYILVDANDITGASNTFELICPENYDPCQNIRQLTCGNADHYTNVETIAGYGNTFLQSCGSFYNYTIGKEIIYEFTASGNGAHVIEAISNFSFTGFIKKSSLGCGPDGWTCIGSTGYYADTWITPDLVEGEKYLLMVIPGSDYGTSIYLLSLVLHCNVGCKVYADADDDGYGDPNRSFTDCWSVRYGYSSNDNDCNDANENIHPGASEICGNHIDDDCDGYVDEDCPCNNITLTITASDVANNFCNGVEYSVTSSSEIQSYNWSTRATTPTLFLTTANAAGNYSVTIHDVNGCPATANFNYNPQLFTSSYTLLAKQSIKLQSNNTVVSGSVGVVNAGGSASMKKNVSIAGTGAFLKAATITIQSPVNIPNQVSAPATVTLPTMQYNTTSTSGLPNVTVPNSTTVTITGNRKNVTIGNNCNVIMTGNVFGAVSIGSGSIVLFTQSSIDVVSITLSAGTLSATTQLRFSGNTTIRCAGSVLINTNCVLNPDSYKKVVMYLGKPGNVPVNFTVATGGNETVYASLYIPAGKLSVGGHATNMTYMNGKFIAESIETLDKNVIWNWYNCTPVYILPATPSDITNPVKEQPVKLVTALTIKAWPNPSEHQFTLNIESNSNEPVMLKVYDMYGRVVHSVKGTANRQYSFGNYFVSGAYIAEAIQGVNRSTVKLIKQ